jgi:phosphoribosylformylglycinamidine synthase
MLRNRDVRFRCGFLSVRVERTDTPFTNQCTVGQILRLPIAHGEGNYYAPPDTVAAIEAGGQVIFRYVDEAGEVTEAANPNGSIHAIAGISNAAKNVVGLMPHPERACESCLGGADGLVVLQSVVHALHERGTLQRV